MKYQSLPVEIVQNGGHHYRQVWRDEFAAVYEQRNAFRILSGFEVITIKRQGPCPVFGKTYPAKEIYPCSEEWGILAVSISNLERAIMVAQVLSEAAKQKVRDPRQKGPCRSRTCQGRPGKGQAGMAVPARDKDQGPRTRPGGGLQMKRARPFVQDQVRARPRLCFRTPETQRFRSD